MKIEIAKAENANQLLRSEFLAGLVDLPFSKRSFRASGLKGSLDKYGKDEKSNSQKLQFVGLKIGMTKWCQIFDTTKNGGDPQKYVQHS